MLDSSTLFAQHRFRHRSLNCQTATFRQRWYQTGRTVAVSPPGLSSFRPDVHRPAYEGLPKGCRKAAPVMIQFRMHKSKNFRFHAEPARCAGGEPKKLFRFLKIFIGERAQPLAFTCFSGDGKTVDDTKKANLPHLLLYTYFHCLLCHQINRI